MQVSSGQYIKPNVVDDHEAARTIHDGSRASQA